MCDTASAPITATNRTTWISTRVEQLMLDPIATVELLEDVQQAGGLAHETMTRALRRVVEHPPLTDHHEYGLNMACRILESAARRRAAAEWERRP